LWLQSSSAFITKQKIRHLQKTQIVRRWRQPEGVRRRRRRLLPVLLPAHPPQGQDLFWWVLENTQSEWKDPVYVIWLSWTSVLNISLSAKNEKAVKEHAGSLLSFSQYHKSRKYWTLLLLRVSCTVPSERHSSLMASFLECVQGIETEFLATIWFSTSWNPLHGLPSFQWSPKCTPKCHQNVTKMYTKESITRSFQFINDHQNVHQNEHQNVHQEHKFS
jgi:hypothetical protein